MDAKQFHQALLSQRQLKNEIPVFLKYIRKERGWTQLALSVRLGIARTYLTMIESGEREMPDYLLWKLDALLNEKVCQNCQQVTAVDICPHCGHEQS